MTKILSIYFKTFVVFFCLDFIWLSFIAPKFYRAHIGHLLAEQTNVAAALVFYLIFIGGLVSYAVIPSLKDTNKKRILLRGAGFGFVTYATFDLTSQAVFRDWPTIVTVVDLFWGSLVSGVATSAVVWIAKRKK